MDELSKIGYGSEYQLAVKMLDSKIKLTDRVSDIDKMLIWEMANDEFFLFGNSEEMKSIPFCKQWIQKIFIAFCTEQLGVSYLALMHHMPAVGEEGKVLLQIANRDIQFLRERLQKYLENKNEN